MELYVRVYKACYSAGKYRKLFSTSLPILKNTFLGDGEMTQWLRVNSPPTMGQNLFPRTHTRESVHNLL